MALRTQKVSGAFEKGAPGRQNHPYRQSIFMVPGSHWNHWQCYCHWISWLLPLCNRISRGPAGNLPYLSYPLNAPRIDLKLSQVDLAFIWLLQDLFKHRILLSEGFHLLLLAAIHPGVIAFSLLCIKYIFETTIFSSFLETKHLIKKIMINALHIQNWSFFKPACPGSLNLAVLFNHHSEVCPWVFPVQDFITLPCWSNTMFVFVCLPTCLCVCLFARVGLKQF